MLPLKTVAAFFTIIAFTMTMTAFAGKAQMIKTEAKRTYVTLYNKDKLLKYMIKHSHPDIPTNLLRSILNNVLETSKSPLLLLAIMKQESHYDPWALSTTGAIGLGQIMPFHIPELKQQGFKVFTKHDLYSIKKNVQSTDYLVTKFMKRANNDIYKMLRYYYGAYDRSYFEPIIANYFHIKMLTQDVDEVNSNTPTQQVTRIINPEPYRGWGF